MHPSLSGRTRPLRLVVPLVVASLVLQGCAAERQGIDASPTPAPTTSVSSTPPEPTPPGQPNLARVRIRLVEVATLDEPLAMTVRPGDDGLYVAEKSGAVRVIRDGSVDPRPVLDLTGQVALGSEQGLLGIAFSPDGEHLYVNLTDTNGDTRIFSFRMRGTRADPSTRREILAVEQPFANHNGGHLAFGPDGYLYIGLGDGGSAGDPHGNAQSLGTLLGKMLRIAPSPTGSRPYEVPPDNPFVGRSGARPEIWAYGLRNPWRYSFDLATGDLWIADVGQSAWEEIDLQPAGSPGGENYGWDRMEGAHPFEGDRPPDAVGPIHEYSQETGGCTVVGGYVYRGSAIPDLVGAYLFADFCLGAIEALRVDGGRVAAHRALGPVVPLISSFGQDADGELYAMSLEGPLYRLAPAR
jgi:glucose/arabinose dehydrogenase